jgi:hypothetical protein
MCNFFVAPLIAADDRDAESFDLRRLQNKKHGLLIGRCRTTGVLIEDHFAARIGLRESGSKDNNGHYA